ncbi:hypothetical protein HMPREF9178_0411 [Streptococcus mitis bv. 2 str. F0392]|uniref:Uncharacterized protein n=1 Tax=Streptococcus mitis bv. 2 str. F0392 TaxID=768726 RepID=F9P0S5_STROR|nr:hypothetical protein HMPREF9178_0411 [Streptococcus mitis bv. 2 str. F0392]
MWKVYHGEQVLKSEKEVVATAFGFGVLIAILVIVSAFLYSSSTMEDNGERNIK